MNDDDPKLRDFFVVLRTADHKAAPSFQRMVNRAERLALPKSHAPGLRLAWSLAACALVLALAVVGLPHPPKARPSLTTTLPVLLGPATESEPLFAGLTSPAQASGSDFLLPPDLNLNPL